MQRYLMYLMNCGPPMIGELGIRSKKTYDVLKFIPVANNQELLCDLIHRSLTDYSPAYFIKHGNQIDTTNKFGSYEMFDIHDVEDLIRHYEEMLNISSDEFSEISNHSLITFYVPDQCKLKLPLDLVSNWFEVIPVHDDAHLILHLLTTANYDKQHYLQLTKTGQLILRDIRKRFSHCRIFQCNSKSINTIINIIVEQVFPKLIEDKELYERCKRFPLAKPIFERMNETELRKYFPMVVPRNQKLTTSFYISNNELLEELKERHDVEIDPFFEEIPLEGNVKEVYKLAFGGCYQRSDWYRKPFLHFSKLGELKLYEPGMAEIFEFSSDNMNLIKENLVCRHQEIIAALPSNVFEKPPSTI
ncbi:hypothetical protein JA1_002223 [Spathaspora sp. JA1]|nr:hypothetical protein JA1_002223 [Spathaspora sp. JA1]